MENSGGNPVFLIAPILLTLIGAVVLFWRINSVQKIFESGVRVVGKITGVTFFKDRGWIEFSYYYKSQNFQSGLAIMKNSKTVAYQNGDEVVLIVDSSNPSRVLIQDYTFNKIYLRGSNGFYNKPLQTTLK